MGFLFFFLFSFFVCCDLNLWTFEVHKFGIFLLVRKIEASNFEDEKQKLIRDMVRKLFGLLFKKNLL